MKRKEYKYMWMNYICIYIYIFFGIRAKHHTRRGKSSKD